MRTALVVDDSRTTRLLLSRILAELSWETAQAGDGQEALDLLRSLPPDQQPSLALVDWNMPNMNGLDFVKAIRSKPAYASLKIMMVTTETEPERVMAALEAGADEYVMKPFDASGVQSKLLSMGLADEDSSELS